MADVDVLAPSGAPPAAPAAPRGPRLRWLVVVTLVVAALIATWVAAPGILVRLGAGRLVFEDGAPEATVDGFAGPGGAYIVGYDHGAYVGITVTVANAGPLPVVVEEVRLDLPPAPLLVPADGAAPGRVAPGAEATASLHLRFDNCEAYHERESMVVDRLLVRARVLGRTVTEAVPLDRPMMARSPMLWQCPDRTLDRRDDRRPTDGDVSR